MGVRIGRLRRRVRIEAKCVERNEYGEEIITWQPVATVWAAVEALRGRELTERKAEGADITTRIVIRYRDGIRPSMRVVWEEHVYDIQSVIPSARREWIEVLATEVER